MTRSTVIALVGMVVGILGWGAANTAMEATNSTEFCISCHEMRDNVYAEYLRSPHYKNASGVRAQCADCHVPRDWIHKVLRKVQATGEVWRWLTGSIDTPEKFQAERHQLAKREWARMRGNQSRECRNCHSFDAMDHSKQPVRAARAMRDAAKDGKTCIDCHKGVAHVMPDVAAAHRAAFDTLKQSAATETVSPADRAVALEPLMLRPAPDQGPDAQAPAGAEFSVLEVQRDWVRVEARGWMRDGGDAHLYAAFGRRVALAELQPPALARAVFGQGREDPDTGRIWTETRFTAWVPAAALLRGPDRLEPVMRMMIENNCTLCHAEKPARQYRADDWLGHMKSMVRLTALTETEAQLLTAHLQRRAKDAAP